MNKPPLVVLPGQSAELAAEDMVAAFATFEQWPDKTSRVFRSVTASANTVEHAPLIAAGRCLAGAIDGGEGAGIGNAYHNTDHFCETLLCAHFLCLLAELPAAPRLEVMLAALIHDFHHDGTLNGPVPFRLERIAVEAAQPYLIRAGVPDRQRQRIAALVLGTDMVDGLAFVGGCHAHAHQAGSLPALHAAAPELAVLADSPLTLRQAQIVREADLLPSVGLTIDHALFLQHNLALEWGRPLDLGSKLAFITDIFPGFIVGHFFSPNVERLRQYLRGRLHHAP